MFPACSSQLDVAGVDDFIIYCIIYRRIWPSSHSPTLAFLWHLRQTPIPSGDAVWLEINVSSLGASTTCATSPAGGEDGDVSFLVLFLLLLLLALLFPSLPWQLLSGPFNSSRSSLASRPSVTYQNNQAIEMRGAGRPPAGVFVWVVSLL
ncbi:hypothetical protein E2C01_037471 [Portunus trituberculatus]|uniref:Uncharacterized protein n=1 Tax=Portunus trituberculatus TaxID=210409 RepID=A0A5B7FE29_PORTR|nr:hypothetical protein [Portunus trituberculatus]